MVVESSLFAYEILIAAIVVERCAELVVSRRHTRMLRARGAVEHGSSHYPAMVALHTAFIVGCATEPWLANRPFIPTVGISMLLVVLAAQTVRWWAISTLGVHWSTRIVVLSSGVRIASGPYRWFPHPNYAAVVAEGIALPLVHSAWSTAVLFTALNAWLLRVRIRTEDAALTSMRSA